MKPSTAGARNCGPSLVPARMASVPMASTMDSATHRMPQQANRLGNTEDRAVRRGSGIGLASCPLVLGSAPVVVASDAFPPRKKLLHCKVIHCQEGTRGDARRWRPGGSAEHPPATISTEV